MQSGVRRKTRTWKMRAPRTKRVSSAADDETLLIVAAYALVVTLFACATLGILIWIGH
jgi:hypothetical protein